jgi:3-hydroxyisobutyrate dehydrogenase-like beta-hydroxyacid dehydrogenase
MSKAAFIGLGAMGSRMAANLLKAGHRVTVSDPAPDAVKRLTDLGAKVAATARQDLEYGAVVFSRSDRTVHRIDGALLGSQCWS